MNILKKIKGWFKGTSDGPKIYDLHKVDGDQYDFEIELSDRTAGFKKAKKTDLLDDWFMIEKGVYQGHFKANGYKWPGFAYKQGPYWVVYIKDLDEEILGSKHGKCFFETTGEDNIWRIHVEGDNSIEGYPISLVGCVREVERYLKKVGGEVR